MRGQIAQYDSPHEPYETLRLESERSNGSSRTGVHVYEMYWADLSRVGKGFFHILGDLYQLIVHIPQLGRQALEHAFVEAQQHRGHRLWRLGVGLHYWAQRMISVVLPLLALMILRTLSTLFWLKVPEPGKTNLLAGGLGLAATLGLGFLLFRFRTTTRSASRLPGWLGTLLSFLALATFSSTGFLAHKWLGGETALLLRARILTCAWVLVAFGVLLWLAGKLERIRPGAKRLGFVMGLLSSVALGGLIFTRDSLEALASSIVWVAEVELSISALVFFSFSLTSVLAAILTLGRAYRCRDKKARRRFLGAAWTARATLALSITFYSLTSVSIAAAVYKASHSMLPDTPHTTLWDSWTDSDPTEPVNEYIDTFITRAAGPGFLFIVSGFFILVLVLLWSLTPLIFHEIWPDSDQQARDADRSERLGRWLEMALTSVPSAIEVLFWLSALAAPALLLMSFWMEGISWWDEQSSRLISGIGAAVTASAVGLLALRYRLGSLVKGLRSGLDRALDVDNYMRENPRDDTPRARIAERYVSLLRYLAAWRGADGKPYQAIILVAHSQGTPVTADLLRFLHHETPADLASLLNPAERESRLYFVSMGSPLAQVYGRAFPHLYYWMNGAPPTWPEPEKHSEVSAEAKAATDDGVGARERDNAVTPGVSTSDQAASDTGNFEPVSGEDSGAPTNAPLIEHGHGVTHTFSGDPTPDPRYLALDRWVNIYRSGDYIGRAFWRRPETYAAIHLARQDGERDDVNYTVSEDRARLRRELCLGTGAHVHYWDATADPVAVEIDLLIDEAIR